MLVVVKVISSFTFVGIAVRVAVYFIRKSRKFCTSGRNYEVKSTSSKLNFKRSHFSNTTLVVKDVFGDVLLHKSQTKSSWKKKVAA